MLNNENKQSPTHSEIMNGLYRFNYVNIVIEHKMLRNENKQHHK